MAENSKGTGSNPLKMTRILTEEVNQAWEDGSFYEKVTPVTQDLLRFWFSDVFCSTRKINFHEGQKQAILNIIYLHEVLKIKNVEDLYLSTDPEILQSMDINDLEKDKYQHPMYAVKMATGTGKTWVLNALMIWQYLNACEYGTENYSKNFLIVAPGLIVYNRLLDSFLGKENEDGSRESYTSDFINNKEIFIPEAYEDKILGFLNSSVCKKEEISSKVTGDGLIAITNWHLLSSSDENIDYDSPLDEPHKVLKKALPISPGTTAGNNLDSLDSRFLKGDTVDYLANLEDIVVFNDEAHHIHEVKKGGEIFEVEWQKSLNKIGENKNNFIQIDFSATPYSYTTGKNKIRHYFPHIIVDFELKKAIHQGLVKMIAIDKRSEVSSISLDFKAERDGRKIIGLSQGQKLMLRAGLSKLKILENDFKEYDKYPKMLIVCEDTKITSFVNKFFIDEGLNKEDILEIHSNAKGEVTEKEWSKIKHKLFNIDKYKSPKIIISVLMLREGFDVNNICVIVPLRSTESSILLEQIIGRGLRLMWREPEFKEIKTESRHKLLVEKTEPNNYLDLLCIIEHPKFMDFYNQFIEEELVTEVTELPETGKTLGDMLTFELKENYERYDIYLPIIVKEREEHLSREKLSIDSMSSFPVAYDKLNLMKGESGEVFESQELTVKTKFGRYHITSGLFTVNNYNELLSKIINNITKMLDTIKGKQKEFPIIQVRHAELAGLIDEYIRTKLFNQEFNPDDDWRIFRSKDIVSHIIRQISNVLYEMQINVDVTEAQIRKQYFSEVESLRMRENYSLKVAKSIYERLPYPSNRGGLEKSFIEAVDNDSRVDSFIKINEYYHTFASITYYS